MKYPKVTLPSLLKGSSRESSVVVENSDRIALRICSKCGHEECPGCKDTGKIGFGWCDIIYPPKKGMRNDFEYCCDGECSFPDSPPKEPENINSIGNLLERAFGKKG